MDHWGAGKPRPSVDCYAMIGEASSVGEGVSVGASAVGEVTGASVGGTAVGDATGTSAVGDAAGVAWAMKPKA